MPLLAQLPDTAYLILACVVVAIIAMIGLGVLLRVVRELRTHLADELKREITGSREPANVAVQQPLEVKEHTTFASRDELQTVKTELHGRVKREREELNQQIAMLREEDRMLRAKLDSEIKDLRQAMDEVPEKTITLLAKTKGLL